MSIIYFAKLETGVFTLKVTLKIDDRMVTVDVLTERINGLLKTKKHLCGNCQALLCSTDDKIACEIVKRGVKTDNRYYVFKCDGYKKMNFTSRDLTSDSNLDDTRKYRDRTYSINNPEVRSRYI